MFELNFLSDFFFSVIGPSIDTTNTTEFSELIKKIRVDGGDDCPEMSLGGIKKGLELCLPNSLVYVFTDADPKDISLLPAVLELIQSKKAKVEFYILTSQREMNAYKYSIYRF